MIALIQRVTQGRVTVDGASVGAIDAGLVALVCAERDDGEAQVDALVSKVLSYRVFEDDRGKMNLSVRDVDGGLLAVPQFTLAADTHSGTRPSFSPAALPQRGERLFHRFVEHAAPPPARARRATVPSVRRARARAARSRGEWTFRRKDAGSDGQ